MINYINRFINMWKLKSIINIERNSDYEVKFWWRDDDVSDSTEELKKLEELRNSQAITEPKSYTV